MNITDNQLKSIILKTKLADEKQLEELSEFANNARVTLKDALLEKNIITDENLGVLIADFLKIPFIVLSKISITENVFRIIPEDMARKQRIIPFERNEQGLKVAIADPTNTEVLTMIAKKTGEKIFPYLATEKDISNALALYRKELQGTFDRILQKEAQQDNNVAYTNVPVAKIVDMIINYAYQDKASDIHIEPEEKNSLIRFRIDGVLQDVLTFPKILHDQLITRIKVLSKLRTDEHLSPQDGKMRIDLYDENLDIRVSILPIAEGEKAVLRLLSSKSREFSLLDLGMNEHDLDKVTKAFHKSYGMVLSTGPTGSGKTTSIYAILKILNTRETNITTIEDPVEYRIKGVNQIQVNAKTNLTFANGLRSILRQDPNIIFVGEIRDSETAGIAVNAALTGHLVLSTIHTNDATTTLPRLIDMKVEPFLVASTVNIIIGQRLLRKICEMCKVSMNTMREQLVRLLSEEVIEKYFGDKKEVRLYEGKGCKVCHTTGYSGRVGIFEVLEMSNKIRSLIVAKSDSDQIRKEAISEGMETMLDDGIQKAIKGVTTIQEVVRVTKTESQ